MGDRSTGDRVRVAVLGASGSAGGELVRLLAAHPTVELSYLGARGAAGRTLREVHPHLAIPGADAPLRPIDAAAAAADADVAVCALPYGVSAELAPALLEGGVRVIDLAGDFRLDAEAARAWYGLEHPHPEWIDKAAYGLPELFGDEVADASLVANPGCFPTPVALALSPLVAHGLIDPDGVVVDGKTGLSGAGREPTETTSYLATEDAIRPYGAPRHRHTPEMERAVTRATGRPCTISFVPHLVPAVRGVVTTCYARLVADADGDALTHALRERYAAAPFVRVLAPGEMVDSKRVRGANVVELQAVADPRTRTAIAIGAVDNLVKGAAGEAVQNLNVMIGADPSLGLPTVGVYP
jgi:N-acetyl-gamma-glutamyl-phosphate reductase